MEFRTLLYRPDGRIARITRHSPEGVAFKARCEEVGFRQAVNERDGGAPIAAA